MCAWGGGGGGGKKRGGGGGGEGGLKGELTWREKPLRGPEGCPPENI